MTGLKAGGFKGVIEPNLLSSSSSFSFLPPLPRSLPPCLGLRWRDKHRQCNSLKLGAKGGREREKEREEKREKEGERERERDSDFTAFIYLYGVRAGNSL